MSDAAVDQGRRRRSTPWPLAAALGIALSELGVFVGLFAVAVVGLCLFGASVAGLLTETGHVARPWPTMAVLGLAFAAAGLAVAFRSGGGLPPVGTFGTDPVLSRSLSVAVGGGILAVAGGVAGVVDRA